MTHDDALDLLSEYVDGELTPRQREALETLMSDDPDLVQQSTQIRNLKAILKLYQGEAGTERFQESLMHRIEEEGPSGRRAHPALWALAVLAAIVIVYLVWKLASPP